MVKRGVDIVVSALLLCLTLPILLLSALIIYLSSPGPVLFRQVRMGRRFQPFSILKLRTMDHAQAGPSYTLGPDPRITPFGRWLRRTKIDELPQLWNVLRGEMSMVGPRPVLPELTAEFRSHYRLLLRQRPGLTDPASLKYSQEAQLLATAGDPMCFFKTVVTPDKIDISLSYMENANVWTDAFTLGMTCLICCCPPLSRLYGRLPEADATVRPQAVRSQAVLNLLSKKSPAKSQAAETADGSAFSHTLAELETCEEITACSRDAPWNLLHIPGVTSYSPARAIKRSVSRL